MPQRNRLVLATNPCTNGFQNRLKLGSNTRISSENNSGFGKFIFGEREKQNRRVSHAFSTETSQRGRTQELENQFIRKKTGTEFPDWPD